MSIKKKVAMGMGSIAMGAMAVMGGTFAYFSDEVTAQSKFTNGTINLQPEAPYLEHFTLTNWKPGDILEADNPNQEPAMVLNNQGTLPMEVYMGVSVTDNLGTADAIIVKELKYGGEDIRLKFDGNTDGVVTLQELADNSSGTTTLNGKQHSFGKYIGFLDAPGATGADPIKAVTYVLEFEDTGLDQNTLQGDQTTIDFTFTGLQYEGETFSEANGNIDNGSTGGGGNFQRTDGVNDQQSGDNGND